VKLPNAEQAIISDAKLWNYLLDDEHPVGKPKARFFKGLGFTVEGAHILRQAILEVGRSGDALEVPSAHGVKYVVDGRISGPSGKQGVRIRTVWIIEHGQDSPRFVTAYPR
jgi:hypothetical protein